MSSEGTGPTVLSAKTQRPIRVLKGTPALKLPRSPSMAFDIFIEPFEEPTTRKRRFKRPPAPQRNIPRGSRADRSLAIFNPSDFRLGSKGGRNLRNIFNVRAREFDFRSRF